MLEVRPEDLRLVPGEGGLPRGGGVALAARRLVTMRKLAAGTDTATDIDRFVADLRQTHLRRPRLQREFDRAGLP